MERPPQPIETSEAVPRGYLYYVSDGNCDSEEDTKLTWNTQGPQGPQGAQGPRGSSGADGARGPQGLAGPQGPMGPRGSASGSAGWGGGSVGTIAFTKGGSSEDKPEQVFDLLSLDFKVTKEMREAAKSGGARSMGRNDFKPVRATLDPDGASATLLRRMFGDLGDKVIVKIQGPAYGQGKDEKSRWITKIVLTDIAIVDVSESFDTDYLRTSVELIMEKIKYITRPPHTGGKNSKESSFTWNLRTNRLEDD